MPWSVGIDEAGYGPNLGPFVMTSVACHVPDALAEADLWQVLREGVRRHPSPDDGRLLVDDSKLVYSTTRGLLTLERSVLATLSSQLRSGPVSLADYVHGLRAGSSAELSDEIWYSGTSLLPLHGEPADLVGRATHFAQVSQCAHVRWGLVQSRVLCPARFNRLLDQWGTKGAVLGTALAELLHGNRSLADSREPISFYIDKHGGRNTYTALLQNALPDGLVIAEEENLERSVYRVLGLERAVHLTFQPRAEAAHFCVALASMVSKYVREVLMLEFNRFWRAHVPDLKPTAGYPGDAARYFAAIRPLLADLGLTEDAVWRRK